MLKQSAGSSKEEPTQVPALPPVHTQSHTPVSSPECKQGDILQYQ